MSPDDSPDAGVFNLLQLVIKPSKTPFIGYLLDEKSVEFIGFGY